MTIEVSGFCKSYLNVLNSDLCNQIIKIYNDNTHFHERFDRNNKPNFTQLNLTANQSLNPFLHNEIIKVSINAIERYREEIPETKFWPKKYGFEEFRIKHYNADGIDMFDDHADATNINTMKRFFAFFWYLNDVEEGGETDFFYHGIKVKPEQGKLFMFPPVWLFPHRGNPPISGEKYLLSSYLHFIE